MRRLELLFVLALLVAVAARAQTYSELMPEQRTITGTVVDLYGKPVEHAFIDHVGLRLFEDFTDASGRFSVATRAPAFVVRKFGYESMFVRAELATEFKITLRRAENKPMLRPCPAKTDCSQFLGSFCFQTTDGVELSARIEDHDYVARYYMLAGTSGGSSIMHGRGYNWSSGIPSSGLVYRSIEYRETVFYRELVSSAATAEDWGLSEMIWDARGTTGDGKRWRYVGGVGESASYQDLTEEHARALDRVLDSICLAPRF